MRKLSLILALLLSHCASHTHKVYNRPLYPTCNKQPIEFCQASSQAEWDIPFPQCAELSVKCNCYVGKGTINMVDLYHYIACK